MDFCTELRTAMDPIHREVEQLPLAQSMASGTILRDEYIQLLQLLHGAHKAWEPLAGSDPICAPIWDSEVARVGALERDLLALGAEPDSQTHPAVDTWIKDLQDWAKQSPSVWLGVVYLFEGSRMGSMALLRPLAQALRVPPAPGQGLDYHSEGIATRVPRWQRIKMILNNLPLTADDRRMAVRAAVSTFEMLRELYSAPASVPA